MMETVDSAHMRAMNSSILLKLIWRDREISRADISRLTGMSRSTVSAIVSDLMRRGLVSECGIGHSNGGRRPVILAFNEGAFSILGLELGASLIAAAVTNLNGQVQYWRQQEWDVLQDPEGTLRILEDILEDVQAHCEDEQRPLIGIGVGLPVPVSPDHRDEPCSPSFMAAWQGHSLRDFFRSRTHVPVIFENDANLGALAEMWWGSGSHQRNLACLKIGRGIGAGLIIDGKIYRGTHGLAGELGYMMLDRPRPTEEGGAEDLNSRLGTKAFLRKLREKASAEWGLTGQGDLSDLKRICELSESGDALARSLVEEAAADLGMAVSNLLVMLDLDLVVIGGIALNPTGYFIQCVQRIVSSLAPLALLRQTPVVPSPLGDRQVAVGAATLILERALEDLTLFQLSASAAVPARDWIESERPYGAFENHN
jgi:predicted NBD/HSP70 family sugar kinase